MVFLFIEAPDFVQKHKFFNPKDTPTVFGEPSVESMGPPMAIAQSCCFALRAEAARVQGLESRAAAEVWPGCSTGCFSSHTGTQKCLVYYCK